MPSLACFPTFPVSLKTQVCNRHQGWSFNHMFHTWRRQVACVRIFRAGRQDTKKHLQLRSNHRQYINEWVRLCANKTFIYGHWKKKKSTQHLQVGNVCSLSSCAIWAELPRVIFPASFPIAYPALLTDKKMRYLTREFRRRTLARQLACREQFFCLLWQEDMALGTPVVTTWISLSNLRVHYIILHVIYERCMRYLDPHPPDP